MKGCPLRCRWCHNPESWRREPEILYYESNCIGCKRCFQACETGALRLVDGARVYDRSLCRGCWKCTDACYAEAQVKCGRSIFVKEVLAEVEKDRAFYENSGGGMTVSGGEPLLQFDFVRRLLEEGKRGGLHTALDTSGYVRWERLEKICEVVDLFLYDLKMIDPAKHREFTDVPNETILDNLRELRRMKKSLVIRIPLVPTYNDSEEDIRLMGEFISTLDGDEVKTELLPYHKLARSKYSRMGIEYPLLKLEAPSRERMESIKSALREYGIDASIGG